MTINNYTIGMAGHIDHGKTTLTKALSGIDTDTLKEEKARKITIEPGFAPFKLTDDLHTSIVDVPGHEKLIRQMIAGVAGIDLVLLVIAADEGVMPQTKEHFEILSFLNIQNGIIVVTKSDLIDEEIRLLVEDDIIELTTDSAFEHLPVYFVDSISMNGIDDLKDAIAKKLRSTKTRSANGTFRMPLDHIFTVKGQGTVVRGTIFEGEVKEGEELEIQPGGEKVKIRKLQVHKTKVVSAIAGQRTAINISGGAKSEWKRGHVLLTPNSCSVSNTIDLVLTTGKGWAGKLKQRSLIKFYTGTAELMGKLILFDRNELEPSTEQVFCQVRLDELIVTKRGDPFIIRRPSPEETIGGGEVIDPNGEKYKFGVETSKMLKEKFEGTPQERILQTLQKEGSLNKQELKKLAGISAEIDNVLNESVKNQRIICINGFYMSFLTFNSLEEELRLKLEAYHRAHSLRPGVPKAEMVQSLNPHLHQKAIQGFIEMMIDQGMIKISDQFMHLPDFTPYYPSKWEKRMIQVTGILEEMGIEPKDLLSIYRSQQLPEELYSDFKYFLLKNDRAHILYDDVLIGSKALARTVAILKENTDLQFTVQDAKNALHLSRKFLIPVLECMDSKGYTVRDEALRKWV
ncbi:selenocysteine-specific translation elongation factor [Bacillus sp. NEB1478]|uniref:selenocysteine-specific translation elongation factor n=1 Tax=Bacillus sp. NEB1478 TaxID=3073816 RepID=UPI0028733AD8|nr:selenocysteine-specific translation elongation factor [Bacillus sp. NEB1478]WNB90280.1 selenocysteine-specific translation elongation factor [Bacillus sp. NEB1478]